MDRTWEQVQRKTFTKWANSHLRRRFGSELKPIEEIEKEMETGIYVFKLINALYDTPIPKHNKNPKMRPHKLDNCDLAISMMDETQIKLNFLKPNHLVDHDLKMILGMVWAIILDYQIKGISVEELSAKEGLLLWCQKKTKGYKDVDVQNFTTSFQDGLAFCALIHRHRPNLLDFDALSKDNPAHNLQLAFDVAESIGIPKLLDVEDLLDVPRPDERSVMTYVSEYFHKFAAQGAQELAGRRIAKVCHLTAQNDALKADYNASCQSLIDWVRQKINELNDRTFENTLEGVKRQIEAFNDYRKNEKPTQTARKIEVEAKFSNLSLKLQANGRPPFTPPDGLTLTDLETAWNDLTVAEAERSAALSAERKRQEKLEALYARFLVKCETLEGWASTKANVLASQEGETFTTPAQVQARLQMLDAFDKALEESKPRLQGLSQLGEQLTSENFRESASITDKISKLNGQWDSLAQKSSQLRDSLNEELEKQNKQEDLRKEFARVAKNLDRWLKDACEDARDDFFGATLEEVQAYEATLGENQEKVSSEYGTKKAELDALDSQLRDLGVTDNKYTFLSVGDIESRYKTLQDLLAARRDIYNAEVKRQEDNEAKCKQFAQEAEAFLAFLASERSAINDIDGEPEEQITAVKSRYNDGAEGKGKLEALQALDNEMRSLGISHNRHTNLSYQVLEKRWNTFKAFIQHTLEDLDHSVALKQKLAETLAHQEKLQHQENLRISFASAANNLHTWLQSAKETLSEPVNVQTEGELSEFQSSLNQVQQEFDSRAEAKKNIDSLGAELAEAGIEQNPLAELSVESANSKWEETQRLIESRDQSLKTEAARQKENEALRKQFANDAEALCNEFSNLKEKAISCEGSIEERISQLRSMSVNREGVDSLQALQQQLDDAGVHDNPHTQLTVEDVAAQANSLSQALEEQIKNLENQKAAQEGSAVSAQADLAEIHECFAQFDKDHDGSLARHELKACLSALDEDVSESALDAFFAKYGGESQTISKDAFTEFMLNRRADTDTKDQILESFQVITGGSDFITLDQLKMIFTGDDLDYLLKHLPPKEGQENAYDFAAFTEAMFSR